MRHFNSDSRKNENPWRGMVVEVRNNNVEGAMRVLKKKLQEDGVFNKLREQEYFRSKGEKRRIAKAAGKARTKKETQRKLEEDGF